MAEFTPGEIAAIAQNPFYAIEIDPELAVPHPPMVTEDQWVETQVQLVKQLGLRPWLRNLLSILKGNWVAGEEEE